MITISEIFKKYHTKLDPLDLELLIAYVIKKPREFILAHSEYFLDQKQIEKIKKYAKRRLNHEPVAYILGQKEFFGLNFKVNKHTLIPRPETESLVEFALHKIQHEICSEKNIAIIDVGTGSGNIIISLIKNLEKSYNFFGIDISEKALAVAEYNAKKNNTTEKIKFIKSNLLNYFFDHCSLLTEPCIILANLPYLSEKIYSKTLPNVKKFEPRSALFSGIYGLDHYEKLLEQIKILNTKNKILYTILEISPEQKQKIEKIIKKYFPQAKIEFQKDLAKKWRFVSFSI